MISPRAPAVLAVAASLLLWTAAVTARAEPAPPAPPVVEWSYAPGCPRPDDLLDRIAERIGLGREALTGKLLRLRVLPERQSSGRWRAQLELLTSAGSGERGFEAESCNSLVEASVLIVGFALDPRAAALLGRAARPRPAVRARDYEGLLRVTGEGDFGVLQGPGLGFGVAGGLGWPRFRLELEAASDLPQSSALAGSAGPVGAELRLALRVGVRGCYVPWRRRVELGFCLSSDGGWLRGTGTAHVPLTGSAFWLGLLGGATAGLRLFGPVWLRADAALGVSPTRPSFVVGEGNVTLVVHRPSLLIGRLGFGLEARL